EQVDAPVGPEGGVRGQPDAAERSRRLREVTERRGYPRERERTAVGIHRCGELAGRRCAGAESDDPVQQERARIVRRPGWPGKVLRHASSPASWTTAIVCSVEYRSPCGAIRTSVHSGCSSPTSTIVRRVMLATPGTADTRW